MPSKINVSKKNFLDDSSWSSNSEAFGNVDVDKSICPINQQWDAIERTLYDEEGDHVTDPELLKECKLWKESFPHLRVRGTKIDIEGLENVEEKAVVKKVEQLKNQVNVYEIPDKTKSIKNMVVGEIVQRLITRFKSQNKVNFDQKIRNPSHCSSEVINNYQNLNNMHFSKSAFAKKSLNFSQKNYLDQNHRVEKVKNEEMLIPSSKKESYFERGKINKPEKKEEMSIQKLEKRISEIFDSWEEDESEDKNLGKELKLEKLNKTKVNTDKNLNLKLSNKEKINLNSSIKHHQSSCHRDSLDAYVKPFELTHKIDKKYEALLNKIMERTCGASDSMNPPCQKQRNTARRYNSEPHTYLESLENIRIKSGYNELYRKRHQNLPKINATNMHNKWLEKNKIETSKANTDISYVNKSKYCLSPVDSVGLRTHGYFPKTFKQEKPDEKFIKELKVEVQNPGKGLPVKCETLNGIHFMRSTPVLTSTRVKESLKFSASENLPVKNRKLPIKGSQLKKMMENSTNDASIKNKTKFKDYNKQCSRRPETLPPIETSIICKELEVHSKISSKTSFKGNKQ